MTVLVTGGAGYIGAHMVLRLLDSGIDAVILDDLTTGFRWAVPPQARLYVGDCGDAQLVANIIAEHSIDAVVHFAARTIVPESVRDPLAYYENNTAKARTLIAAAIASNVRRFVFSSTAAVYGQPKTNPVAEDAVADPVSPYGRSKLMVEWMLEDASRAHDFTYAALRYFNVAGADPDGRAGQSTSHATHLVKVCVQAALGLRREVEVFGTDYQTPDGSCLRDYIHVSDLAQAHMDALHYLGSARESLVCNCGYARGYSVLEVIAAVKAVSGVDFPVRLRERRPGDPAAVIAANRRVSQVLGWRPRYDDLHAIVRDALEWERGLQLAHAGV